MTAPHHTNEPAKIPVDSVRLVVRSTEDPSQFLLVAEADDPDNWKLPGGKFEENETAHQAMNREAAEELGLTGLSGTYVELLNDDGISRRCIFSIAVDPAEITLDPDEGDDPERIIGRKWVTLQFVEASGLKNRDHILAAVASTQ